MLSHEAKNFNLTDVFDALTSERPYHSPVSCSEAIAVILGQSGIHVDPTVVDVLKKIQPAEIDAIRERYSDTKELAL